MSRLGYTIVFVLGLCQPGRGQSPTLQQQLTAEGVPALVKAARQNGDARRGAVVFHQPSLACAKCHEVGQRATPPLLGPDLTRPEPGTSAEFLVESVLDPSKVIRKGFEPLVAQLSDGRTVTGLIQEETTESLVLRDVTRAGEIVRLAKSEIDERAFGKTSIMPAGQVNVLASRQQFLDLARYLIEIAEGGSDRARQLMPPPSLFAFVLPDYEKQLDHAGLLQSLDDQALKRGEAIYSRLCVNCHGTKDQPGSLPTSLKFADGKFKNGSDPYRMYQTLTHGFGLMAPQTWMVPQQKYDVVHYVRETYLKPYNQSQYVPVDAAYLASLPQGTTRGPAPSNVEAWSSMNYGPYLAATYEVGNDQSNFAHKGVAVRLDPGPGGISRGKFWQVFDHDTLRMAAGWSNGAQTRPAQGTTPNFIDWHGINFDGRHQIHPRLVGDISFANPTGPGWAHPETQSFEDTRILGRDQKHYGPLSRDWGRFRGVYQYGDQVILSYQVGTTDVLEMPGGLQVSSADAATKSPSVVYTRTFHIGPRSRPMLLKVATHPSGDSTLKKIAASGKLDPDVQTIAVLQPDAVQAVERLPGSFDGKVQVVVQKPNDFDLDGKDYTITARIRTQTGGTIFSEAPASGPWAPNGKALFIRGGRLTFDIGWVGAVTGKSNIADGKWHDIAMTCQHETGRILLFVDGKLDGQGSLKPKARLADASVRLGCAASNFPDPTFYVGQMSDVKFFQRRLSEAEIAKPTQMDAENRVAYWKLDPITQVDIADETGRGHDGRVVRGAGAGTSEPALVRIAAGLSPSPAGAEWKGGDGGSLILQLPPGNDTMKFVVSVTRLTGGEPAPSEVAALLNQEPLDLQALTTGGPRRWTEGLRTEVVAGPDQGPFGVDILTAPASNPWLAQLRLTGFDFFADGDRLAICSWDGDVWIVSGLSQAPRDGRQTLTWKRIANGLFQPLGLKIVDGQIYVTCRDQIAILKDLNGDGETDYVECFNSDHQVTEHFHEFAMGLQTDSEGNFYYAKSARHALPAVVPHHGTLLRVSRDGSQTDIVANGFRAANGVCLNPDGTFVVTDQEGHWNPKNRINWVVPPKPGQKPRFYGNMFGYHDVTDASDSAMEPPLCWITNEFDRSPAELLWVTSEKWGPLNGSLLNLSYGYGKVFVVPFEKLSPPKGQTADRPFARVQGGLCELPLPTFPTGIMRGRFHPRDGQLYTCGMFAWAGNATQPGGFYRIRATGRPVHVPIGLKARKAGIRIDFSGDLDPAVAAEPSRYTVKTWSLKRTANYGSKHHDEKMLVVSSAKLSDDHRSVTLELPDIQPTWCMSIEFKLAGSEGEPINGLIHNTVHSLE